MAFTRAKRLFIVFFLLLLQKQALAGLPAAGYDNAGFNLPAGVMVIKLDDAEQLSGPETKRPNPLLQAFRKKRSKDKKVVAALLAFPFPFGIVGLHRIYLGCSPYVPVVYIATAGGVLGILPFIDFCVLLLDNDIDRYINNKKIFMWVN